MVSSVNETMNVPMVSFMDTTMVDAMGVSMDGAMGAFVGDVMECAMEGVRGRVHGFTMGSPMVGSMDCPNNVPGRTLRREKIFPPKDRHKLTTRYPLDCSIPLRFPLPTMATSFKPGICGVIVKAFMFSVCRDVYSRVDACYDTGFAYFF